MPSVEDNLRHWGNYHWTHAGEKWSSSWNGTEFLWWATLLPRLHAFLPAPTILEIAPGFGRITHYLKDLCNRLILVDLSERCIEACRSRFASHRHISYHVNDGRSLEMVPEASVDVAFSFDSLVHAEVDVIEAYVGQLAGKLTRDGIGFIHHSNLKGLTSPIMKRVPFVRRALIQGWRAETVNAEVFAQSCSRSGLQCISQELLNWNTHLPLPIDCISIFTREDSKWARGNVVVKNMQFFQEAVGWAKLSRLYAGSSIN